MKLPHSIVLIFIFMSSFLGGCETKKGVAENQPIDFRLDTLQHDRFYLNQQRGKTVLLVFWATWCNPCKSELVELKSLAAAPQFKNVVFAGACIDPENIDDVKTIVKTLDLNYLVLLDENGLVSKSLGITAVPTTIIVNPAGNVSFIKQGFFADTIQEIKKHIENLVVSKNN